MNEQEMRELFRDMRDEPVPADSLARVRASVDQRIHERPWMSAWKIAAVLAMAGCIVAGFLLLRPEKAVQPVQQLSAPEIAQVVPAVEIPVPPERSVVRVARAKHARPRPVVEGVPVSIRIETPDPDVVILLVN
jgi:hypothetical protein